MPEGDGEAENVAAVERHMVELMRVPTVRAWTKASHFAIHDRVAEALAPWGRKRGPQS